MHDACCECARHANLIGKLRQLVFAAELVLGPRNGRKTGAVKGKVRRAGRRWSRAGPARRGTVVHIHVATSVDANIDVAAGAAIGATLTRVESLLLSLVLPLPVENVDLVPMV
jgi:hypothetical protein